MKSTQIEHLEDRIEPNFGLLDNLLSAGVLSRREIEDIKSKTSVFKRNKKLLIYIEEKKAFESLKTALRETNQLHLANYLSSNGEYKEEFGDEWPLSKTQEALLDINQSRLIDLIEPTELIDHLIAKKVITQRQHTVLKFAPNEVEKNDQLIGLVRRSSRKNYQLLIDCLNLTQQSQIADILAKGGVICEVHLEINGREEELDICEKKIVESFVHLLKKKSNAESQIIEILQSRHPDVQLISVRQTNSISFYFRCVSLDGLMFLIELLSSGQFKPLIESILEQILSSGVKVNVHCSITDFKQFEKFFAEHSRSSSLHTDHREADRSQTSENSPGCPILNEETVCCICAETYSNPRSLPCLHTFCFRCLEQHAKGKKPGERISCPVCRKMWKLPVDGLSGFPRNTLIEKLVKLGSVSVNAPKYILCDVCLENNVEDLKQNISVAAKHCVDCQQNMCTECVRQHTRLKLCKDHEVKELKDLGDNELVKIKSTTCDRHPRKPMVVYCNDCQVTMCQNCFDESHQRHSKQDVRLAADQMQQELDDRCDTLTKLVEEIEIDFEDSPMKLFLQSSMNIERDIEDRFDQVKKTADYHKIRLCEYLKIVEKRILCEFGTEMDELKNHKDELEIFLKLAQDLRAQGSISDITSIGPSLLSRATELQSNYQSLHSKLKTQTNWPEIELVPIDIDDLLSFSTGNLLGKIKVANYIGKSGDSEYYGFADIKDKENSDDYADCRYHLPRTSKGLMPSAFKKENLCLGCSDELDSDEYEPTEEINPAGHAISSVPIGSDRESEYIAVISDETTRPPLPPPRGTISRKKASSVYGSHELDPSSIVLQERLRRGKSTEIWLGVMYQVEEVSVKIFSKEALNEPWIVKSCDFFREADVLRNLQHKNIVKLIGVSCSREPFYVVTEMTSKRYLDNYLKSDGGNTITFKDIIRMATQITSAMHYLGTMHCIHRYLAAKSILVGADNNLKLTNFEMATFLGKTGQQQSTYIDVYELLDCPIKYKAPEVIRFGRWSAKSDVWSFGIILYQLVTYGKEPYPDMNETDLVNFLHVTYNLPCPAGRSFDYPDKKLLKMMQCCWFKDPIKRPDFKYLNEFFEFFSTEKGPLDLMGYPHRIKYVSTLKDKKKKPVSGVLCYKNELFISRNVSFVIETYNTSSFKQGKCISVCEKQAKFKPWKASPKKLTGLQDISVCAQRSFLYAGDWNDRRIYAMSLNSRETTSSWQIQTGEPTGLSVNKDGNVLVSCSDICRIFEFTFCGVFVLEVAFGCNSEGPRHAIQSAKDHLVVLHGNISPGRANEGVSAIDIYGKIVTGTKSLELQNPSHLIADSKGHIFVAEKGRNRIVLANHDLAKYRVLLTLEQNAPSLTRIHLDESRGQLFVGLQDGSVMIYETKAANTDLSSTNSVIENGSYEPLSYDEYDDVYYEYQTVVN